MLNHCDHVKWQLRWNENVQQNWGYVVFLAQENVKKKQLKLQDKLEKTSFNEISYLSCADSNDLHTAHIQLTWSSWSDPDMHCVWYERTQVVHFKSVFTVQHFQQNLSWLIFI